MEQKRTLWVAAAAGVFLLVVIGAALIFWRPSVKDPVISTVQPQQNSAWVNPAAASNVPGTSASSPAAQDAVTTTISSDTANIYTNNTTLIDLGNISQASDITTVKDDTVSASQKTVSKPTVTETPAKTPAAAATASKTAASQPAASSSASAAKSSTAKQASTPKKTTATEYWVQTGAFSTREYAENAQDSIAAYKIESEIFTKVVNGKTWYRVRMGPYKTHTEADYWMTVIRSDPIFADSYITEVKGQ